MIGIIGKKLGMTQLFNSAGQQIPCTVIEAEPNSVLSVANTSLIKQVQRGVGQQRTARDSAKGERPPVARAPSDLWQHHRHVRPPVESGSW
jgi:ribosomal protein L3